MLREKLEQRRVAEVFFEIGALAQIFAIDFRHGQSMPPEVPGEFEKRDVFFTHVVQDANGARSSGRSAG